MGVRVWRRMGLQAFLKRDEFVGEVILPLGLEILNIEPCSLHLPISNCDRHAGAVWIGVCLVEKPQTDEPTSAMGSLAAVGGAVGSGALGSLAAVGGAVSGGSLRWDQS